MRESNRLNYEARFACGKAIVQTTKHVSHAGRQSFKLRGSICVREGNRLNYEARFACEKTIV